MFLQCVLQRTPHLLGADVMHNMPVNAAEFNHEQWQEWDGPLTREVDACKRDFLGELVGQSSIPNHTLRIVQVGVGQGGLGMLAPGARAAADFVLRMTRSARYAREGIRIHRDLRPARLHRSVSNLFDPRYNSGSRTLQRYHKLLPHLAQVACSPSCPPGERLDHFSQKVSVHSARGRISAHCSRGNVAALYATMLRDAPEHVHHLPSILVPQTLHPLITMIRSTLAH